MEVLALCMARSYLCQVQMCSSGKGLHAGGNQVPYVKDLEATMVRPENMSTWPAFRCMDTEGMLWTVAVFIPTWIRTSSSLKCTTRCCD